MDAAHDCWYVSVTDSWRSDTDLLLVVSAGQTHAVHELVDAGADVNATNGKGQTPL
jgi:ankyrin repeat protein